MESETRSVVSDSLRPLNYTVHAILQARIGGCPFPSPGDLPNPGIEPRSPALRADSLPAEPPGKPRTYVSKTGQHFRGRTVAEREWRAGRAGVFYYIIDFGRHCTPQVLAQGLQHKYKWLKVGLTM